MKQRKWRMMALGLLAFLQGVAQTGVAQPQGCWWVHFADKGPDAARQLLAPEGFLSPQALHRRLKHGVPVTLQDVPVHAPYLAQLRLQGAQVLRASRWMNAAYVCAAQPALLQQLPFVRQVVPAGNRGMQVAGTKATSALSYGVGEDQLQLMNLPWLHNKGFTGQGVHLAMFDSGFQGLPGNPRFDSVFVQGRMDTSLDFFTADTVVWDDDDHGALTLSLIAANSPGTFVGGAPQVRLGLFRTENALAEQNIEEVNWLAAAELADSLGYDLINSSLGYNEFDAGQTSYVFADMDGQTTLVAQAASWAAQRGMLVVNSAGNEGNGTWKRITSPCDADSILCVGAVKADGQVASFSGRGPSADGRVKPDVAALGQQANFVDTDGSLGTGNGTSFAAPLVSALAASLMSAHPTATSWEVQEAIRRGASQFLSPDSLQGYGIPDAARADSLLSGFTIGRGEALNNRYGLKLSPNPSRGSFSLLVQGPSYETVHVRAYSLSGQSMPWPNGQFELALRAQVLLPVDVSAWPAGTYLLQVQTANGQRSLARLVLLP